MYKINLLTLVLLYTVTSGPELSAQNPYELNLTKDGILLGAGLTMIYLGYLEDSAVPTLNPLETKLLSPADINGFDRFAINNYSESAANLSDWLIYTCLALPVGLLISDRIRRDAGIVYTMYGESLLYGTSITLLTKSTFPRFRPYVYNTDVPSEYKFTSDARKSFFSGHTSIAFTSLIFFASIYSQYYPDSQGNAYVWTGSVLLASSVGFLRIAAGMHFPTDVLTGAIAGAVIGYLIPKIHESNKKTYNYNIAEPALTKPIVNLNIVF